MESESLFIISDKKNSQVTKNVSQYSIHPVNLVIAQALKLYLDILYFLCIVPIRYNLNIETKVYFRTIFLPQRLLCLVTLTCTCIWMFYYFRFEYPSNKNSPKEVFMFLEGLVQSILLLNFFKVLWFHHQEIESLLNYVLEIRFSLLSSRMQQLFFKNFAQIFILVFRFIFALLSLVTSAFPQSIHISQFNISDWMMQMLSQSRQALLFYKSDVSDQGFEKFDAIKLWSSPDYLVFVFGLISSFYCRINLYISEYYMYLMTAVMWSSACSFAEYIRKPECNSWTKLNERYKVVHSLSRHVNQALSFMALWWCVGATFYLSLRFNIIFVDISAPENINANQFILGVHWLLLDSIFACGCSETCSRVRVNKLKLYKTLLCILTVTEL